MGFSSLAELASHDGADLLNRLEKHYNVQVDPCVEDTLRWIVDYARTGELDKTWYDFTAERKAYRLAEGYPADRPQYKG
ncbi:helix-hairpin-helix domain-containing protein [Thalassobacillus sp. CUG 92003]|uniref:helix-hairpin-helix domain-containing protein n=1 Tax=Thalassobacillus sp. CUG 92003 TaxID=2736641 RepID=UPI0015E6F4AC|nr:helix-hairpin-helix domain-containing protein [Thalassobacillus sp. CUG 92003]